MQVRITEQVGPSFVFRFCGTEVRSSVGHAVFGIIPAKGDPGSDGVSPAVQVTEITGGHRVTVTDATGTHTFDVMDGAQGDPGETGNGIASIVKTATSGLVDTYTITYTDGSTTTYTVTNGAEGDPGEGVPTGGTTGQMLVKATDADYDAEWVDPPEGEVTQAEFDALKQYVLDMSPVTTVTAPVVSVTDAAPLDAEGLVVDIEPVQAGSGDPSPENVRPISGWTGANVTRTGKNLLKLDESEMVSKGWNRIFPVSLKAGTYILSCQNQFGASLKGASVNLTDENDSTVIVALNAGYTFGDTAFIGVTANITEEQADKIKNIRFALRATGTTYNDIAQGNIQLELGSTATAYEPYQGDTYDIAFPSAAGTVYGGTLDVVSGELVVDRAMVDLGTLQGWTRLPFPSPASGQGYCFRVYISTSKERFNAICSGYQYVGSYIQMASVDKSCGYIYNTSICIRDDSYDNVEDFVSSLNGVQLVYELANPVTYILTPQQIALLRGNNTIWADTGSVSLTYRQDVAKLLEALMKPDESDMVASATYAANSFFTIGGTLYKATAAIATGETIQPGVNCIQTTVADQLTAIFAQL